MIFRAFDFQADASTIASFYEQEWKIPAGPTLQNLSSNNVILQLVLIHENEIIATGGLYHKVGIHQEGNFTQDHPWLALMYVQPIYRGKGIGAQLLEELEKRARKQGFEKVCLFTRDQQGFYQRSKWILEEKLTLKDQPIFLMHKYLK